MATNRIPNPITRVAEAFAELSDADREMLALVAWEGLSHEEIAAVLGLGRPAVRLRLYRARRRFAAALRRRTPVQRNADAGQVSEQRVTARPGTEEAL